MAQEHKFSCPYCGTVIKAAWKEGTKPVCPNCSAQLDEQEIPVNEYSAPRTRNNVTIILISILVMAAAAFAGYTFAAKPDTAKTDPPEATIRSDNSIYVEQIDRTCRWVSSAESYFDPVTDCHFWYNDEIDYPTWQYYYGSISGDFGDFGWMEYREDMGKWYIEESEGHWIQLPPEYDTENLWHMNE